jgi:hypothetical protein
MKRARTHTVVAGARRLATHAEAWPDRWEGAPSVLGYFGRHGAWHLATAGRVADAVAFVARLLASPLRESLVSPEQAAAAVSHGLGALALATTHEADAVDGQALVELLLAAHDRALLRPACRLLAGRTMEALAEAFAAHPNPSVAAAYVLAEELARRIVADDDRAAWEELARVGADHEHPVQYSALYAFKYVGCARPRWLSVELLEPFATGGPYDRLAVTTLLLYLALQGDPFPASFDVPAFWEPRWEYNREEISLVRGAMAFRGLAPPRPTGFPGDDDALADYLAIEERRAALSEELPPDAPAAVRTIVSEYWRLVGSLEAVSALPVSIRDRAYARELGWLLLVSPYWEVSEGGSSLLARFAVVDDAWRDLLLSWATGDDPSTWWGALAALRLFAGRTGREEELFEALRVQSRAESAQLRGNCANTLHTLVAGAAPARRDALLARFEGELRALLHGEDVWEVNEVLLLAEHLEAQGVPWEEAWDAANAPLLALVPDWREAGASAFGDAVSARVGAKDGR